MGCGPATPHPSPVESPGTGGSKNVGNPSPRPGISLIIDAGSDRPLLTTGPGCPATSAPVDAALPRLDAADAAAYGASSAGGSADGAATNAPDGRAEAGVDTRSPDAGTGDAPANTGGSTGRSPDGGAGGRGGAGGDGRGAMASDGAGGDLSDGGNRGAGDGGDAAMVVDNPGLHPAAAGELAIVELLVNPSGTDTGREWIEVLNRSARAISLAGLHVADSSNEASVEFGDSAAPPTLAAGGRAVLIQSGDPSKNGGVRIGGSGGVVGGTFGILVSLNNDADQISLCMGPCASGVIVDRVGWEAALGPSYDGHALVAEPVGLRCPASSPFGDAGSFGTPGAPGAPCP